MAASVHPMTPPISPSKKAFDRSLSPTSLSNGVPSNNYVVVWEWETKPHRWRPYSPEVTQLLERAHWKKINKIYLKDADPLLCEYFIDMINFEQVCEPTNETYPVRREYYAYTSPAAKGAKWEWGSTALSGSEGSNSSTSEWHIYDMEVQTVIEEAWANGEQTIDIGQHFPGCPYIINFCNLTQVRRTTGAVRPIRRQPCASYPMVKLTPAEIASMLHRKEERRKEFAAEVERRIKEFKNKKQKKAKKAVKHLMNHLLHPNINLKELKSKKNAVASTSAQGSPQQSPMKVTSQIDTSTGFLLPSRRVIGHPSASSYSEAGFPQSSATVTGRRSQYSALGGGGSSAASSSGGGTQHYRRFHDYASFSSFSDTSSCIVRRPSVDTISTYLSSQYRYGGSSRTASSYYGGSFGGSQDLIDMFGHETDSVFTDEDIDQISFLSSKERSRSSQSKSSSFHLHKRVLSDPAIHQSQKDEEDDELYVNLKENLSMHSSMGHQSVHSRLAASQQSLVRSPRRGDTILSHTKNAVIVETNNCGTLKKRPIPTPRTILNTKPNEMVKVDRMIRRYSQFVIDPNGPDDYCPVCNRHLEQESGVHCKDAQPDLTSVICLTSCQHKVHMACLRWTTPDLSSCLKCPTCGTISGLLNGDMPTLGASMTYKVIPKGLPGYDDYHAIQITYNMSSGVQDARHPYPGSPYYAIGFPKTAFLPDTELGRIVLRLLEKAFNQHLTFTLDTNKGSRDAMVVWNPSIGHKTEFGPSSDERNSFPDPGYLDDVLRQLGRLGISTENNEDDEDDEEFTNV